MNKRISFAIPGALAIFLLVLVFTPAIQADDSDTPGYSAFVAQWTQRQEAGSEDSTDKLIRYGIMADRNAGHIELLADTTTVAHYEPVEFLLIGPPSGHAYEAFARAYASASDVFDALVFLGVPVGRRVDFQALRYWPRGERIRVDVRFLPDPEAEEGSVPGGNAEWIPAEEIVFSSGQPLPAGGGFVFTGAYRVPDPGQEGPGRLVADVRDPYSLIALYNEPRTVLDVPYIAPQGSVYGSQRLNPDYISKTPRLVKFRLTPELLPGGISRPVDVDMRVRGGARYARSPLSGVLVNARTRDGSDSIENADLTRWLAFLERLQEQGRDIYIHISPDPGMLLEALVRLYTFLDQLNVPRGARLDGRPEHDIYYQAFIPPPDFRKREKRPGQPWELHLYQDTTLAVTGALQRVDEIWEDHEVTFEEHVHAAPTPEAMRHVIETTPDVLKVVLVFAPETMTYGQLLAWYEALPEDFRTIYIYTRQTPDDIVINDRLLR